MSQDHSPLHTLWSKAVGTPDYDKEEWKALEAKLSSAQSQAERWKSLYETQIRECNSHRSGADAELRAARAELEALREVERGARKVFDVAEAYMLCDIEQDELTRMLTALHNDRRDTQDSLARLDATRAKAGAK